MTCVKTFRIIPSNKNVHARSTFVERVDNFDKPVYSQPSPVNMAKYLSYLAHTRPFIAPISHTHETDKDETMAIIWCWPPQNWNQYLLIFTKENGFEEIMNIYPPLDLNRQICRFTRIL